MADDLRTSYREALLDHVRADRFPSPSMLDLVESTLGPEGLGEYGMAMVAKLASERYPSPSMLTRLARLVALQPPSS